ncbi:MAG: Ig domain-containing protein [Bryobacteraceae bacterium]|nr:Ig domain-containing protein [Bryobacteraceae bacterium]
MLRLHLLRLIPLALVALVNLPAQTPSVQVLPVATRLDAFVGENFSQIFTCSGCPANTVFTLSAQLPLPAGLTFSSSTATLSGVPTTAGQTSVFSIIATANNQQLTFRSYTIGTDRRLTFVTPVNLAPATAGLQTSRDIQVNLPSSWDTGNNTFPPSISITVPANSTTLNISGVFPAITSPTSYSIRVFANYPVFQSSTSVSTLGINQQVAQVFTLLVNPAPTLSGNFPVGQIGVTYGGGVVTNGGTPPFTYSLSGNLPPGLILNPLNGTISGVPTLNGTFAYQIGVRDANGANAFVTGTTVITGTPLQITSLTFPPARVAQSYSAPLTVNGGTGPYTWTIVSPTLPPPGITVSGPSLAGIPNTVGQFSFTIRVQDGTGASTQANVSISVNPAQLTVSPSQLPDGTPNAPYLASLAATGGQQPYVWTLSSGALPAGLTLSSAGVLSGTPTASGVFSFSVRVTDTPNGAINYPGGAATRDFTITVGPGPLTIPPTTLPPAIVGQAFTPVLSATGGRPPYTWGISGGNLPAGVNLLPSGVFSGSPTVAGPSTFTVQVRDADGTTATREFTLTTTAALTITPTSLDDGVVGVPYSATLSAQNGTAPFTFALDSGTLPAGVTLSPAGILTGNPAAPGTANFTVRVTDRGNLTATRPYTLVIRPALAIVTDSLPNGSSGAAYSVQVAAQGGTPPYAFTLASGSLPGGLTLSNTGLISGTPSAPGTSTFTVRVTDSRNLTATSRAFNIVVTQPSLPTVSVTQITDTTGSASQPSFGIALSAPFPAAIDGTVTLAFQPDAGPADPDVRFASGGTTLNFTIPAGGLNAVAAANAPFTFGSGTTSGLVTLTVVLRSNGQTLLPNPAAVRTVRINRAAPVITNVRINRTATGFEVIVTGYSNTREIASGNLRFNPAPGVTLQTAEFPLNIGAAFQTWYASAPSAGFGTQFLLTMPFTVADGTAASLSSALVTLTNTVGSGSGLGNF